MAAASADARPATAAELRWLVQRAQRRGLAAESERESPPARQAWGGEVLALLDGVVRNGHRALRLGDEAEGTSLVCSLAFAHMPERMEFPGGAEWLAHYDMLDLPVEASVRFRVMAAHEAARQVNRQVARLRDQAEHIAETSAEMPLDVQENYEGARELERAVLRGQQPLIVCWPRLMVSAPTQQQLAARVTDLVEHYRGMGIELVRPGGDQLALFLEAMPGDRLRVRAYEHRMPPVTLAGSMYGASSEVGDRLGPYLGQTAGLARLPVTFDPLLAAPRNRPTAVSITGAPGSGKTNTALLLAYQARLRGTWVVIVDPKAEATGLAELPGLGRIQRVRLDASYEGLLDPYQIEREPEEASLLAAELCRIFLPPALAREVEARLVTAAAAEAGEGRDASLWGVVDRLDGAGSEAAREAAGALRSVSRMPMARMCFGGDQRQLRLDDALTVIQFAHLSLPATGTRPEDYAIPERLAVGLMRAVTALAGQLIEAGTPSQPKMLVLDEAWALTSAAEGQRLVERLARTGRSKNTALLLVTQNARDLLDERVTQCLSVRLGCRPGDERELRAMLGLLEVEPSPELMTTVSRFAPGECLLRDLEGRVGRVQVDLFPERLREAFDTTPRSAEAAHASS